jgi:phosphoheptose isomerase
MRRLSVLAIFALTLVSTGVQAGAKDDFIKAVKAQCKKDDAAAKALATPGRSGNVIKFKTCSGATVQVGDCTLQCKDASSTIGG